MEKERLLTASWDIAAGDTQRYNAHIIIRAMDQVSAIAVLSMATADMKLPITGINGHNDKASGDAIVEVTVSLADVSAVDMLIKKLLSDKRIYDVHRASSL